MGQPPDDAASYSPSFQDQEDNRRALLALLEQWRQAHYATDVVALLAHDAETVLYVRDGEVLPMSRADVLRIYGGDFQGASYQTWEYIEPPQIRVADDGSIAWVITRTQVRRTKPGEDGIVEAQEFIYAGVSMYEKRDGGWRRIANVSTFADDA